ncbi:MAG: zinc-ribbon domain-containing protein [Deltaproteobacteria bacterium]|nr:zinc-ribbon domain-containing protein [Deltaproteobacteria bacterium]
MEHKEKTKEEKDNKRFITPGGAGLAAICFFLPWVRACGVEISGFQIANEGGDWVVWVILIVAIVILGCFFWFGEEKTDILKPIVVLGGLLGLAILVIRFVQFLQECKVMYEIRYGAIGTLIGFILSIFGLQFIEDSVPKVETEKSENQSQESALPRISTSTLPRINFCPECGAKVQSDDKFCQECGNGLG